MACPPGLPSRPTNLGLGRSSSVAFGRTKTYSLARPAHQVRDAARAPRGRRAVPTKSVFEAAATQDWRPRLSGRTLRPNDDAVPPMEHIEDDRSDVLDADDVDRDTGCSRCGTRRVRGGENHCGTRKRFSWPNGFIYVRGNVDGLGWMTTLALVGRRSTQ